MTQDAFELLQAANPLPEDPPPLPIAPLLERVDEFPPQPPAPRRRAFIGVRDRFRDSESGGLGKRTKRRPRAHFAVIALGTAAVLGTVGMLAFTRSTTAPPPNTLAA